MGDLYLSDVISVEDIVKMKENRICIISGVGSGKNYFVEHELKNMEISYILHLDVRK